MGVSKTCLFYQTTKNGFEIHDENTIYHWLHPNQYVSVSMLVAATFTWAGEIDSLVCFKKKRMPILYSNGAEYKKYKVSLGKTPVGAKTRKGDNKTPEGRYLIVSKIGWRAALLLPTMK
jgi:murein L,D-transpeptidase YafK